MIYPFYCQRCDHYFDVKKTIAEVSRVEDCPLCGQPAERKYTPIPHSFGWRLTDESHNKIGHKKDEIEKAI